MSIFAQLGIPLPSLQGMPSVFPRQPVVRQSSPFGAQQVAAPAPALAAEAPLPPMAVDAPDPAAIVNAPSWINNLAQVQAAPEVRGPASVFDRVRDFISSDEGRAALLRSGAATLEGGLGAGVAAGAGFIDQRRREASDQAERDRNFDLRQQGVNIDQQQADIGAAEAQSRIQQRAVQAGIDMATLAEAIRKNHANEALDAAELRALQWYRSEQLQLGWAEEGGRNQRAAADNAVTMLGQRLADARHDRPSGDTVFRETSVNERTYNPPAQTGTATATRQTENGTTVTVRTPFAARQQNRHEGQQVVGEDGNIYLIRNGRMHRIGQAPQ